MQIQIQLEPQKQLFVPFNYNYQLQSAIYRKLSEIGASDFWHDKGFGDVNKFKAFSFGSLKGRYEVQNNKILFENNVSFEVRSPIFEFCDDLQRAIELFPRFRLFDTELRVTNATIFNKHINKNKVFFSTDTPITVYSGEDNGFTRYYTPDDEEFYIGICNNFENKFEAICRKPAEKIMLRPAGEFRKVVTRYKQTWITAYRGRLEVQASPESLEFLYNTGMGGKNSQGFGFLKL
ncbi:MAG: CRISPR-associated endoribonuclease Cas6 [Ruminococcus sp.]